MYEIIVFCFLLLRLNKKIINSFYMVYIDNVENIHQCFKKRRIKIKKQSGSLQSKVLSEINKNKYTFGFNCKIIFVSGDQ